MEDQKMNNPKDVPFIAYEYAQSRLERIIKRLWILCIILIVLLVGSNISWLIYESQFEYYETSIEAEQDGDGVNIVGGGDVSYGAESNGTD